MNSYVERVIKSIVGHASAMLWHAGVQEDMWALAAKASTYLHNRVPNKSLEGEVIPYEIWTGRKPHAGHIRIWGCRAWAAVPKQKRKKWDSKTSECILVGFYDTENLYQLWDIEKRELVKKRDVIFHEHILGHPILAREKLQLGWEITGEKTMADEEVEIEEIEEMYPVIDDLKYEEEKDIPESVLDMNMRLVENMIPQSYEEAMRCEENKMWRQACESEHDAMIANKVYDWIMVDKKVKILPAKWVFTIKRDLNGEIIKYKARIVAGGHRQRKGIDFKETFAPVAKFASLRILLILAANNNWEGEQGDIVTAFLNGELEEEVLVRPPNGIYPRKGELVKGESEAISENKEDRIIKQDNKV